MKPMDDEYIRDKDIVRRYLRNTLMPEEAIEFETYVLDKPALLEQLELDAVLIENMPQVEIGVKAEMTFWQKLLHTPIGASLSTAATCLLIALLYVAQTSTNSPPINGDIELFYLSDIRGENTASEQTFHVKDNAELLIFVLQPEFDEVTPYAISLSNKETGEMVELLESYTPNAAGEIYVSTYAKNLKKGIYLFEYFPIQNEDNKQYTSVLID